MYHPRIINVLPGFDTGNKTMEILRQTFHKQTSRAVTGYGVQAAEPSDNLLVSLAAVETVSLFSECQNPNGFL